MKRENLFTRLLDVPATDPDDARRRKLLNVLLLSSVLIALAGLVIALVASIVLPDNADMMFELLVIMLVALGGTAILYAINRYAIGWVASALLLSFFLLLVILGDTPEEVANGRSLINFAIIIVMASVLLRPYASFIAAGVSSLSILVIALRMPDITPNWFAMLAFFSVAFISWVAARNLEQALRSARSEASKNLAILEGIADGVIVFDLDEKITTVNPAIVSKAEHPAVEVIGQDIDALLADGVSAEDREQFKAHLGKKTRSTFRLQWGNRIYDVSISPVTDANNRVTGMVAVLRDFTHETEIERVRRNFVSIASHELRTPVGAILGYAEILQTEIHGPLADKQRHAVNRIVTNAGQMLRLANNLLDQARIEAGSLPILIAPFNMPELLDNVRGVMAPLAQNAEIELRTHIADDVPDTFYGDRLRLYQILVNLVSNAIKFTEKGQVDVRIYLPDANHWALQVQDTGYGISREAQAQIFDPFQKTLIGKASDTVERGAGLGLAIVKQLTEIMNGEIRVKSEIGSGSTFTIVLPLLSEADVNLDDQPAEAERLNLV